MPGNPAGPGPPITQNWKTLDKKLRTLRIRFWMRTVQTLMMLVHVRIDKLFVTERRFVKNCLKADLNAWTKCFVLLSNMEQLFIFSDFLCIHAIKLFRRGPILLLERSFKLTWRIFCFTVKNIVSSVFSGFGWGFDPIIQTLTQKPRLLN